MTTTIEQRIEAALRRNPEHLNSRITKNLNNVCRAADVQAVRDRLAPREDAPAVVGGISLGNLRVMSHRPAETAALRLKRLPMGQGFEVRVLAADWGCSEETIRKHAKDLKCLKYAELKPGEWVQLVMNPETAARYHS